MRMRFGLGFLALMLCCLGCNTAPKSDGKIPITTSSEEARTSFLKGRELADNLRRREAKPLFEEALGKDPNFAMAHVMSATLANSAEDYFSHIKAAVASATKASEGERLLVEGFEAGAMGDLKKRGQAYTKLVEMFPADERAHQLLALHLNGIQDFEGAAAEYKIATEIAPGYAPAYNQLGYVLSTTEKYAEAEAAFRKYIELIPNEPNPYDSLAELLMKSNRLEESIEQYRKALDVNGSFTTAHRGIAANLMYLGRHADALAELQILHDAAATDEDRGYALMDMAIVLTDEGKSNEAIEKISAASALAEKAGNKATVAQGEGQKGEIYLHARKTDEAKAAFARAHLLLAETDLPEQPKKLAALAIHGDLALVAAATKDFATARKETELLLAGIQAMGNSNQMRQAQQVAGIVALEEMKWDDAIKALQQANQQSPYVQFQLGRAYERKGDKEAAKSHYTKAANANTLPSIDYALIRQQAIASAK